MSAADSAFCGALALGVACALRAAGLTWKEAGAGLLWILAAIAAATGLLIALFCL